MISQIGHFKTLNSWSLVANTHARALHIFSFEFPAVINKRLSFLCSYSFWTSTATSLALMMHVSVLRAQGHIPVNPEEGDKLRLVDIPCIPPVHPFEFFGAIQRPSHVMHKLVSNYADYHVHLCGILVNSVYELESSVFDALTEHYVATPGSKVSSSIALLFAVF